MAATIFGSAGRERKEASLAHRPALHERAGSALAAGVLTFALALLLTRAFPLQPIAGSASSLQSITLTLPLPEISRPVRKPAPREAKRGAPSPPNLHAEPTEIVAPRPQIPVPLPPPVVAAPIAGVGAAASAGSADIPGPGTGAGGQGNGRGAGGNGDGDGGSPPRQIRGRIKDSDYPRAAGEAGVGGTVGVRYSVEVDGRVTNCRVTDSSGNAELDAITCALIEKRFRFRPSRDAQGKPVPSTIVENHTWVIDRIADAAGSQSR